MVWERLTCSLTSARRITGIGVALCIGALPATGKAQEVPARLSVCASITDSIRRLSCFDEGLAHLSETAPSAAQAPPVKALEPGATVGHKAPRRATATVVRIEDHSDDLIIHLANGEVWEQAQEVSATMNLRAGDQVSIEHSQGADWLEGPSRVVMKVRQRLP